MSQDWIESLRKDHDAMHPSQPTDPRTQVRDAFLRIRAEIHVVVERLNREFSQAFKVDDLEDGSLLVEARASVAQWTGARLWFDEQAGTVQSHPSAQVSLVPGDLHVFTFDLQNRSFAENGESVTDDELVRRALDTFLKSSLGLSKA